MRRLRFVVTAGPTREYLDPVRFLSNPSTGKMGFAVAMAAAKRGYDVTLIAGPVSLKTPAGVRRVDVVSAREMLKESVAAVSRVGNEQAVFFVSTAAVADWRPAGCAAKKLKKSRMSGILHLVRNPDILRTVGAKMKSAVGKRVRLVGFAAETGDATAEALRKCREKRLSLVVANDVTTCGAGFGTDTNLVTFVYPDGVAENLPLMSKLAVAGRIVRACERMA